MNNLDHALATLASDPEDIHDAVEYLARHVTFTVGYTRDHFTPAVEILRAWPEITARFTGASPDLAAAVEAVTRQHDEPIPEEFRDGPPRGENPHVDAMNDAIASWGRPPRD